MRVDNDDDGTDNVLRPDPIAEPPKKPGAIRSFLETLAVWHNKPAQDELSAAIADVNERARSGQLGAQGIAPIELEVPRGVAARRWLPRIAAVVVAGAMVYQFYPRSIVKALPDAFHGAWKTTNVRYSDRQMWLSSDAIAFQIGPTMQDVAIHEVRRIDARGISGDTAFYQIVYEADGADAEWPVALVATGNRSIAFRNQPGLVWTPAPGPVWPR